jgi:hypothetical protein
MKFSSALKFNAVPEWWDDYIAYVSSSPLLIGLYAHFTRSQI